MPLGLFGLEARGGNQFAPLLVVGGDDAAHLGGRVRPGFQTASLQDLPGVRVRHDLCEWLSGQRPSHQEFGSMAGSSYMVVKGP